MILSLIAAASINNIIGKDNKLLWSLPNDMKFFKNTTWAMPIIMGRKTFDSLGAQPLPGRFNIVITRQKNWDPKNDKVQIADSLEKAISLAEQTNSKEAFIIGGGQIYSQSISIADNIYLTRVFTTASGDAHFPEIKESEWELSSKMDFQPDERHVYGYSFQVWARKRKK